MYLRPFFRNTESVLAEQFAFGHREILQLVGILGKEEILAGTLQHGWFGEVEEQDRIIVRGKTLSQYPHFVWSQFSETKYNEKRKFKTFNFGSPWAWMLEYFRKQEYRFTFENKPEKELIYFPMHGFQYLKVQRMSLEPFQDLRLLPPQISISLFWTEFLNVGIRKELSNNGFSIFSAGYRGNSPLERPSANIGGRSSYLFRVFQIISSHEYVLCDEVSTSFWYALSLRKKVYVSREVKKLFSIENQQTLFQYDNHETLTKLNLSFNVYSKNLLIVEPISSNVEIARKHLGFEMCNKLDKKWVPKLEVGNIDNSGLGDLNEIIRACLIQFPGSQDDSRQN